MTRFRTPNPVSCKKVSSRSSPILWTHARLFAPRSGDNIYQPDGGSPPHTCQSTQQQRPGQQVSCPRDDSLSSAGHPPAHKFSKLGELQAFVSTHQTKYRRIAGQNLTQGFQRFRAHEDRWCVKSLQDDIQDGVEVVSEALRYSHAFGQAVHAGYFLLGRSKHTVNIAY